MSIRTKDVPDGGAATVANAVACMFDGDDDGPSYPFAAGSDGSLAVEVAAPHPLFVVDLKDVAEGRLLGAAEANGWRYLVLQNGKAFASANLYWDDEDRRFEFSHTSQGEFVEATVDALRAAEALPQVEERDFDLRLLDVPALNLRALWLRAEGAEDILVPLKPAPETVTPFTPYSEAGLLAAVRTTAEELLARPGEDEG